MPKLITLFFCALFFVETMAQPINLPVGKQFAIKFERIWKGEINEELRETYLFRSLGKNSNGDAELECRLIEANNSYAGGESPSEINTLRLRKAKFGTISGVFILSILNKPFNITLSKRGYIIKMDNLRSLFDEAKKKWQLEDGAHIMLLQDTANIKQEIQDLFLNLPVSNISFNSEWSDGYLTYKITGIKGALLEVSSSLIKPDTSKHTGSYLFNDVTGLTEKAVTKSLITENGKTVGTAHHAQEINYNVIEPIIDTAWINMAVRMSQWSETFNNNVKRTDSSKFFSYVKHHDVLFKGDDYYELAKLNLMAGIKGDFVYKMYYKALEKIPNKFLAGSYSHLYNKLSHMLDMSADSTFAITQYIYKSESFNVWLQQSLAQSFQDWDEGENRRFLKDERDSSDAAIDKAIVEIKKGREISLQTLNMYHTSKVPLIRRKSEPLYLWVTAKANTNNVKLLLRTANKFKQMNDEDMHLGNGGRYALLTYELLMAAKKYDAANSLLLNTLKKLERYTTDTLNNYRYADQNLLAHAYYLQYKATKDKKSTQAMQALSQAARYSPQTDKQKAYESFYDRVFLHSKESYQKEFLDTLFKIGDKQRVLAVIADRINADIYNLGEMQQLFTSRYPEDDFSNFLTGRVLSTWKPAPDFKLKSVNGTEHTLSTYKKKWLVIDFWGTWCPPCRYDMPGLNKFNAQIINGEHAGIDFLSIACYDTADKVKTFFAENNYNLPVLMSNTEVQRQYNIKSFPTKVLISPDGKMLPIVGGGMAWLSVLTKLNSLYAAN